MKRLVDALIALVALFHAAVLVLEMFFWDHPLGHRIFGLTPEVAAASKVLAANQGLYNGFLAAGLVWALVGRRRDVALFFLACVVVAGVFGGLTAKASILFTQGLPAALALIGVWASGWGRDRREPGSLPRG
jgi:putative membrane protein